MTRGRLRGLVRKRLGETTAAFWSDTELNDWINDAGIDVVDTTKCIKTNGYLTTAENDQEYLLAPLFPTLIHLYELYYYQDGTTWKRLDKVNKDELNTLYKGWRSASSGTPFLYYWDREEGTLGLYPPVNANNAGTNYARLYYARSFPLPADDSTDTGIPKKLELAMVDFVVATGYESRGYGDKSNDAWNKYTNRIKGYLIQRDNEQIDDEDVCMKPVRNQ